MRRVFLILFLLGSTTLYAQLDIVALEYYIDTDPGVGAATSIPVSQGQSIDINYTIPVSSMGLSVGVHLLVVRAQDTNGDWGIMEYRTFYINASVGVSDPIPNIDQVEYFIDEDPGTGNGTSLTITPSTTIDINELIPTGVLSEGVHTLNVRARNANGLWGIYETRLFLLKPPVNPDATPADLVAIEYFFDVDPGMGNATSISITPGQLIDINQLVPQSLSQGLHVIGVRAQNADGDWGMTEVRKVYITPDAVTSAPALPITQLEYYFNDDPGIGSADKIEIDPDATDVDIASILLTSPVDIPVGTNKFSVRAQNSSGLWGFPETREFDVIDDCTQPVADFTPSLACAGEVVNFIDNSLDIQPDAEYRWYFDGDGVVDDLTIGSTSFTFNNPGTYTVALAISQGQICYDSLAMDITIKPQPFVVFNAERVEVGNPTPFTVEQFNVDPSATWAWDFDTDAIIDDNTAGDVSYTYPADGVYLATLTVDDGLGCNTVYSKSVTVDPIGSGGGLPNADFQVNTVCSGETTTFTDLSSNLPVGSTYSWDFDNDGIEDSSTAGTVQFTYASSGTFTATLTINTGTETLTHSEIVNVVSFPAADFSITTACAGSVSTFTDLTSSAIASATYRWDFDGDGVIDDTTVGDVSHTYSLPGTYSVLLTVNNGNGCFDTRVRIVEIIGVPSPGFTANTACAGESTVFADQSVATTAGVVYSWDFDNDGIEDSNQRNPEFIFTSPGDYNVSLTLDNGNSCMATITQSVTIQGAPTVDFTIQSACIDDPVLFVDASTNVDPAATYTWDFNSDNIVDDVTVGDVTHTYSSSGMFATLSIDNGAGCIESVTKEVVFADAAFTNFSVTNACLGESVVFTDLSTNTAIGATYAWDFESDGTTDSQVPGSTSVIYDAPGIYDVTLTISNNGCEQAFSQQAEVYDLPELSLPGDTTICEGSSLVLDPGPGYASYLWTDQSQNQTLEVTATGTYGLTVTDSNGCENSASINVGTGALPTADFEMTFQVLELSAIVNFENLSANALSYQWDFGDGSNSTLVNPSHEFTDIDVFSGSVFEVCLTSSNTCDTVTYCELVPLVVTSTESTDEQFITIYPNPSSSGTVFIDFTQAEEDTYHVYVYDAIGKLVRSNTYDALIDQDATLTIKSLASGSYQVHIQSTHGLVSQKIIVQ